MVNGCDGEVKTYAHSPSRSVRNSPSASPSRTTSSNINITGASSSSSLSRQNSEKNAEQSNGVTATGNQQNGSQDTDMMVDEYVGNGSCDASTDVKNDDVMDTNNDVMKQSSSTGNPASAVSVITNSKGSKKFL